VIGGGAAFWALSGKGVGDGATRVGGQWIHILLAVLTAAVAMLGPGAWSIDARRFGRQRFDIDRNRGR
jgi:hypothetical protein